MASTVKVAEEDRDAVVAKSKRSRPSVAAVADSTRDGTAGSLFHKVPTPAWIYDPVSLAFLDVNEAAVASYGYSREIFLTMSVLDIRPEGERDRMRRAIEDRSDLDSSAIWRHRKANGSEFDAITRGCPITFAGRPAVMAVALDRTETQDLRRTLGETRLLLDAIIEAMPSGVFLKDMADGGRYLIYNPAMATIAGRDARSILGRIDREIFGMLEGTKYTAQDHAVMRSGQQLLIDDEAVARPDGEVRRIRTVKTVLPAAEGEGPRYILGISEDITARRRSEEQVAHMAMHDALTNLPNRLQVNQHIDRLLMTRNPAMPAVLMYLDLDLFKTVNDSFGHHVGDRLLQDFSGRLRAALRAEDFVARLGGDEFAIVARVAGDSQAMSLAERVLKCLVAPFDLGDCIVHIGVSVGIALDEGGDASGDLLMRHAEIALYAAKAEGRGTARLYEAAMSAGVESRHVILEDLRRAVAAGELFLDYQPIHDLSTERISGFEALVRWQHPTRGLISPVDFIPLAEQSGLIVPIGEWVLAEACREAVRWPQRVKVAVNLSAVQFRKPGLVETVTAVLQRTGLPPQRLELEITETVVLLDTGANHATLHALRDLGVRIAMDDFGIGYSSLSYLRAFPFDKIKMDRSFVADLCDNAGSLAVARAVIGLGSSLSITTTAEGVETPEQFRRLKTEGFDELQGFLIGRPMSALRARALLRSGTAQAGTAAA